MLPKSVQNIKEFLHCLASTLLLFSSPRFLLFLISTLLRSTLHLPFSFLAVIQRSLLSASPELMMCGTCSLMTLCWAAQHENVLVKLQPAGPQTPTQTSLCLCRHSGSNLPSCNTNQALFHQTSIIYHLGSSIMYSYVTHWFTLQIFITCKGI